MFLLTEKGVQQWFKSVNTRFSNAIKLGDGTCVQAPIFASSLISNHNNVFSHTLPLLTHCIKPAHRTASDQDSAEREAAEVPTGLVPT